MTVESATYIDTLDDTYPADSDDPTEGAEHIRQLKTVLQSSFNNVDGALTSAMVPYTSAGTSAVATTVQAKLRESVSVKDFGATGDGVTDDTTAIQAAIDYAETVSAGYTKAGIAVYFPSGEYLVSSQLTVTDDYIRLYGDGPRSSVIFTEELVGEILKIGKADSSYLYQASLENLAFEVRGGATSGGLVEIDNVVNGKFNNLSFLNFYNGLILTGVNRCYFNGISVTDDSGRTAAGNIGILLQGDATSGICANVHIINLQIVAVNALGFSIGMEVRGVDGLYLSQAHLNNANRNLVFEPDDTDGQDQIASVLISNTYFDSVDDTTGVHNITFKGTAGTDKYIDIQITNSIIRDALQHGIRFEASSLIKLVSISNCQIRSNQYYGISCGNANIDYLSITGTTFNDNNVADSASYGDMKLFGDSHIVNGCQFIGGHALGTAIDLAANDSIVSACGFYASSCAEIITDVATRNRTDNISHALTVEVASTASLSLPVYGDYFKITGTADITSITASWVDRTITLRFAGTAATNGVVDGSNIVLAGGADFGYTPNDTLHLVSDGTNWYEISRSVN